MNNTFLSDESRAHGDAAQGELRSIMLESGRNARRRAQAEDQAIGRPEPGGWQGVARPSDSKPWKRLGISRSSWYEAREPRKRASKAERATGSGVAQASRDLGRHIGMAR
jgi:hypothetical protein